MKPTHRRPTHPLDMLVDMIDEAPYNQSRTDLILIVSDPWTDADCSLVADVMHTETQFWINLRDDYDNWEEEK